MLNFISLFSQKLFADVILATLKTCEEFLMFDGLILRFLVGNFRSL